MIWLVLVSIWLLPMLGQADGLPVLAPVTDSTAQAIVAKQRIRVSWQAPELAQRYTVKVKEGKTLIKLKHVKHTRARLREVLFKTGHTYTIAVRARKTTTHSRSRWTKILFTYDDTDNDNDTIVDEVDSDDDDDGIVDSEDALPNDHDNDGITDAEDDDDDNDLLLDKKDLYPLDHDNDGIPDKYDADDDNDGIADVDEVPGQQFDEDNDGIPDHEDEQYIAEHTPPPQTYLITIHNDQFTNGNITIRLGDTVIWTNKDSHGHIIIARDGDFPDSDPLDPNDVYLYRFIEAGEYIYEDPTSDVSMVGKIIVTTDV